MTENDFSRRQFIKVGGISLIGTAVFANFGTRVFATSTNVPFDSVRFAVITDMHIDIKGKNKVKMSAISVKCLSETVVDLNREKDLSFVLVAGDLLLDGEWENALVVKNLLNKLTVPYYVICGNHDFVPINPKKHREGFHYLSVKDFVKFFKGHGYDNSGKRYYAHQIKPGLRLIGLDACLPTEQKKWGGILPKEQLKWLDKQLTSHADELNLVFMHHNLVRWSTDELIGGTKQWFCIDNEVEVRNIFSKHAKAAPVVISGHRHIGLNFKELNCVNYFSVPSLNSHPMRYSVFTISNLSVSWKTPMVNVPEYVHLEARQNLLNAKGWRLTQFKERNTINDSAMLQFLENNDMILGSIKI
ncbi:Metallophosphoesterase [Candidatus Thiomargarita nelsonii]|uniref:Metallophosphoesterase n=1 Tax=Candidatus Thiomargarita nelsonii TaxID=1003181 RepID=A0A0A6NZA4_9GAMM|nr:Metallophosphoesterase [Candidatus Thiomargarita nelsonii]